jgi:hypothetical protein
MPAARKAATVARKAPPPKRAALQPAGHAAFAGNGSTAEAKPEKPRKLKVVRDSFTIPKSEYAVLDELKARAAKAGRAAKKSEVLRAGVKALAAMSDPAFLAALAAVPAVKTAGPAKA